MLDVLQAYFKKELQYSHVAGALQQINNLVSILQVQHLKEPESKNAAIDAICAILQSHKDVKTEV